MTNDERRVTSSDTNYESRDTRSEGVADGAPVLSRSAAPLRVAVVGPCASGKSTLVSALRAAGYDARHPAQEHSFVPDMWRRLVDPDVLIYLDLSHAAYRQRRPKDDAGPEYLDLQRERLAHARAHADVVIDTSKMTAEAVSEASLRFLNALGEIDGE